MCMQDWRIGRFVKWDMIKAAQTSLTVPQNRQRVALRITLDVLMPAVGTDALFVRPSVQNVDWYAEDVAYGPWLFTIAEHGEIIQERLLIGFRVGGTTFTTWQATLPDDYLAVGLQSFESEYSKWKGQR